MDCRERSRVPGVQELQKIKSFAGPDFAEQHPIGPVAERSFEKVADRYGWHAVLFPPGFEPDKIFMPQLNLGRIFDQQDAFIRRNEFPRL